MSRVIDTVGILKLLPQRYPFLLVDRVLDYEPFKYLTAIKNVTMNEPVFQGHFPGNPIMPGVFMLEALAQTCILLSNLSRTPQPGHAFIYFFASIDKVKFKQVVVPGDQLRFEVKFLSKKRDFWRLHGEAFVDEKCVFTAELMSAAKEVKSEEQAC